MLCPTAPHVLSRRTTEPVIVTTALNPPPIGSENLKLTRPSVADGLRDEIDPGSVPIVVPSAPVPFALVWFAVVLKVPVASGLAPVVANVLVVVVVVVVAEVAVVAVLLPVAAVVVPPVAAVVALAVVAPAVPLAPPPVAAAEATVVTVDVVAAVVVVTAVTVAYGM